MVGPKQGILALVLLAASLAGCIGFDDPGVNCSSQHPYADRLVFEQEDVYDDLGEAMQAANESSEATWNRQLQGAWSGARGAIETVNADGRVYGDYDAALRDNVPYRVQDSALSAYGPLWLDQVRWNPNGTDTRLGYHAPDQAGPDEQSFTVSYRRATNLSEAEGAEYARTLHDALFPEASFEPLDDPGFAHAWSSMYSSNPETPVDADGLLADLIDAGDLEYREASFEGVAFPHTLGILRLEGQNVGPFDGVIHLRLGHDARAIAAGNDPTLVLEATPADRASVANLGSAPLGAEELEQMTQERFGNVTALAPLALDEATYEEGGEVTVTTPSGCSGMTALGQPLEEG